MKEPKINEKYKMFCLYYLETGDRVEAYSRVYGTEIKRDSAKSAAYRLLQREDVKNYLNYLIYCTLDEVEISLNAARLLEELTKMALSPDHMYPSQKYTAITEGLRLLGLDGGNIIESLGVIKSQLTKKSEQTEESQQAESTKWSKSTD